MAEHHASVEADEQIDLDGDINDIEDMMDERVRDEYNEEEQHDEYREEDHGSEGEGDDRVSSSDELNNISSPLKDERQVREQLMRKKGRSMVIELLALPPHGSQVVVGGLPRDVTDEELRDLCESFGDIYEVRLVRDKDKKENKGFAFFVYTTKEAAQMAVEEVQDKDFKGRTLRCSSSQVKHRLFSGNVPKSF
ncbi:hypothetical protein IEQ34_001171 [Dendrobium chrysotoxum]|uniref:RRM domain-containing protein n=1 Tax=Dendrobium chrysotoxum TaxID=161865 RepID=A0AAV7HPS0_DENCH|nr:hypothetical protein IEQ34_001171 [Dendrobium chrysotoxum]